MSIVSPTQATTPSDAAIASAFRHGIGHLSIRDSRRAYALSGSPFTVPAILPLITLAFVGAGIVVAVASLDTGTMLPLTGGLAFLCMGLLAIPALTVGGTVSMTDRGIAFSKHYRAIFGGNSGLLPAKGEHTVAATWRNVSLFTDFRNGLCLRMADPEIIGGELRMPGGLHLRPGDDAVLPLRMLGDRKFAVLDAVRENVEASMWSPALERSGERSRMFSRAVYAATTLFCCGAILGTWAVYR